MVEGSRRRPSRGGITPATPTTAQPPEKPFLDSYVMLVHASPLFHADTTPREEVSRRPTKLPAPLQDFLDARTFPWAGSAITAKDFRARFLGLLPTRARAG